MGTAHWSLKPGMTLPHGYETRKGSPTKVTRGIDIGENEILIHGNQLKKGKNPNRIYAKGGKLTKCYKLLGFFPFLYKDKKEDTGEKYKQGGIITRKYGFFGSKEKAEAKKAELKKEGIETKINEISVKGSIRYQPEEI